MSPYASFQNDPLHPVCEPDTANTDGQYIYPCASKIILQVFKRKTHETPGLGATNDSSE